MEIEPVKTKKLSKGKKAAIIMAILLPIVASVAFFFIWDSWGVSDYNHALQLAQQKQYAESLEFFERAKPRLSERTLADAIYSMGFAHMKLENFEEAIAYFMEAEKMYLSRSDTDQERLALLYKYVAISHGQMADLDEALVWHVKSMKIWETLLDMEELVFAYIQVGNIYAIQEKHEEATEHLVKAYRVCKSELYKGYPDTEMILNSLRGVYMQILINDESNDKNYLNDFSVNETNGQFWFSEKLEKDFDEWLAVQLAE